MVSKPKTPKPLDVPAVSAEQTKQNQTNLGQQTAYNRIGQTDAFGNTINYYQNGTDANGNPIFSQVRGLGDQGQEFAGGLADLGRRYFEQAMNPDGGASGAAFKQADQFWNQVEGPRQ